MKKLICCVIGVAMFSNVANAAICKDFDDDMNIIEYECGTSLSAAIKANNEKIEKQKLQAAAERKAQEEQARLEQEKIAAERAAEKKAQEEAEKLEQERIAAERAAEKAKKEAERKAKEEAEKLEKEKLIAEIRAERPSISAWDAVWWKWKLLHFEPFAGFEMQYHITDKTYSMDDGTSITDTHSKNYGPGFQLGLMVSNELSNEFLFARYEVLSFGQVGTKPCDTNSNLYYGRQEEDVIHSMDFGWGTKLYKSFNGYAGFGIGFHSSLFYTVYVDYHPSDETHPQSTTNYFQHNAYDGCKAGKIFVGLEYKLFNWLRLYTEPTVLMSKGLAEPLVYVPLGVRVVF